MVDSDTEFIMAIALLAEPIIADCVNPPAPNPAAVPLSNWNIQAKTSTHSKPSTQVIVEEASSKSVSLFNDLKN
ncbi:hypothetical protein IU50_06975 [Francisella tularensis]|nr:hypothetical protein IU42_06930 [Francisella tularensis]KXO26396.1 hypothetical protein IU50_06975 [Francisella tularensis]KXO30352.1 hypothetical protein IU40_06955 [Francisella tularensis]KXO31147.1 hypothetical protein IU43_06950 [Francisella tularensis]KXO31310.1 hypothetical protein IU44_06200 [Francisella tularensis]